MASRLGGWWRLSIILIPFSLEPWVAGEAEPQVPCYFVFGDSYVDNGNNNRISNLTATFLPYGIDFPLGPTGRFSNGRTMADVIAKSLGFQNFIPCFQTTKCGAVAMLKGVNYASAGSGILDESGENLGSRFSFNRQLEHHRMTTSCVAKLIGSQRASQYLGRCLYTVFMGSNDYLNNYYLPNTKTSNINPDEYADHLIHQYTSQLKTLYKYGARKISLFGVGHIGCFPGSLLNGLCNETKNRAARKFNERLILLVDELNQDKDLSGAKFIYVNYYGIYGSAISGFRNTTAPCCKTDGPMCKQNGKTCPHRREYAFWDTAHPTEMMNLITGGRAYRALSPNDAYPTDINTLVSPSIRMFDHNSLPRQQM